MQVINECLKRTTDENTMYGLMTDALDIAVSLEGKERKLLTSVTCSQSSRSHWAGLLLKSQNHDRNVE